MIKMKYKNIMFGILFLVLINSCFSLTELGTFKTGDNINLLQLCGTCSYNNITSVTSPNSSILVSNVEMTKTGTQYNYTLDSSLTNAIGTYNVNGVGDLDGNATVWAYTFFITPQGTETSSGQGLYLVTIMIFLVMMMVLFGLATWYFDNGLKFFFLLLTALTMLVGLNISSNIASSVYPTVGNVLWTVYRVSIIIFMFLSFVVLTKLIGELKLRRNAMNIDNLDSPGQNKKLIRGRGK